MSAKALLHMSFVQSDVLPQGAGVRSCHHASALTLHAASSRPQEGCSRTVERASGRAYLSLKVRRRQAATLRWAAVPGQSLAAGMLCSQT